MLKEKVEGLYEECDELMNSSLRKTVDLEMLKYTPLEDLETWLRCVQLYNEAKELSIMMAEKLDKIETIDKKLDKLLGEMRS